MRSILFSLTLVFFTGCLTEATTANPTDDLDEVTAVAVDPGLAPAEDDQPSDDERAEADRQMRLDLVQQDVAWGMAHDHPRTPPDSLDEPDCRYTGAPLDPRCKHPH